MTWFLVVVVLLACGWVACAIVLGARSDDLLPGYRALEDAEQAAYLARRSS